jgi:hypothetical protein
MNGHDQSRTFVPYQTLSGKAELAAGTNHVALCRSNHRVCLLFRNQQVSASSPDAGSMIPGAYEWRWRMNRPGAEIAPAAAPDHPIG